MPRYISASNPAGAGVAAGALYPGIKTLTLLSLGSFTSCPLTELHVPLCSEKYAPVVLLVVKKAGYDFEPFCCKGAFSTGTNLSFLATGKSTQDPLFLK